MAASAEQIKYVIEARQKGASFADISKETGIKDSMVKYLWYNKKPKSAKTPRKSSDKLHYLTPKETDTILYWHKQGLKSLAIMEKMGPSISRYNIYKAIKEGKTHSNGHRPEPKPKERGGYGAEVFKLKSTVDPKTGKPFTLAAIAKKLGIPKGTASSAYYNFKPKGEELNGNNAASHNNGTVDHKGWTLEAIAGACSAEVTRVITGFADTYHNAGPRITPEAIQRRVLELLEAETVRPAR